MGFGYRTARLAVPGASVAEVADALGPRRRRAAGRAEGTEAAHREAVFAGGPVGRP
ncbi:hypothetical protein HCJ76_07940 [Streptomyces sp. MC1]|uniref:hypothetical protein n=1 Tax=unclassified Streptomyces TaxID=2593676 RepID=UPI00131DD080|nr:MULTISPECIES: hypothetical protein [unclassified Streptomyces]MBG7698009.1 hypothetical protein [Streptomyces sp. MC1]